MGVAYWISHASKSSFNGYRDRIKCKAIIDLIANPNYSTVNDCKFLVFQLPPKFTFAADFMKLINVLIS